jgi:glycogen phosphorylase
MTTSTPSRHAQPQHATVEASGTSQSFKRRASDDPAAWFAQAMDMHRSRSAHAASPSAVMQAVVSACRGQLLGQWGHTQTRDRDRLQAMVARPEAAANALHDTRRVHYLSMEFLMGRAMGNAIAAMGLQAQAEKALAPSGTHLGALLEGEGDAALGNGGLGRLAACFLDAMAELGVPAFGYGLRYQYGMFAQQIVAGEQREVPDDWMRDGNPWEVPRPELQYPVGFGGHVSDEDGQRRWHPAHVLSAQAYDFIVPAHLSAAQPEHVVTLRQWHASAEQPIEFHALSRGDVAAAGSDRTQADALNWVLYPDDSTAAGRALRLRQEAFLVSASVQDMLARHLHEGGTPHDFARRNAVHLNDTHPALASVELMRVLLDEHLLSWDAAWTQTLTACSYTNHTLMPEALETWPVSLFEQLLPRHLDIIFEINARFLTTVRAQFPGDEAMVKRVSLISEDGERRVRMAALSIVASRRVNGVSALHSQLMVDTLFADYARIYPGKFFNVTNGVTPRRWLKQANAPLSTLLDEHIGIAWRRDMSQLSLLRTKADDPSLAAALAKVKQDKKNALATWLHQRHSITVDPHTLFDVQVKRIHEYKRQLLNLLSVAARWQSLLDAPNDSLTMTPRTVIIAGKAASAYKAAKQIIRLANDMARVINADGRTQDQLKLVFIPDYGVNVAERVMPAADLSQQISTAGTEASGTGNMKFALNGALTIGTWDGANIEMAQSMGAENMFVFGLHTHEVAAVHAAGTPAQSFIDQSTALARVLDAIEQGVFSPEEPGRYRDLVHNLRHHDRYLLCADFGSYVQAQARVDARYAQPPAWHAMAARNIAGMGPFSADRAVLDYVQQVWALPR